MVSRLRRSLRIDHLESNTCVAHSFALVGSQASHRLEPGRICCLHSPGNSTDFSSYDLGADKATVYECVANMEGVIGRIYSYFGRSCTRQRCLKDWQDFLDVPN